MAYPWERVVASHADDDLQEKHERGLVAALTLVYLPMSRLYGRARDATGCERGEQGRIWKWCKCSWSLLTSFGRWDHGQMFSAKSVLRAHPLGQTSYRGRGPMHPATPAWRLFVQSSHAFPGNRPAYRAAPDRQFSRGGDPYPLRPSGFPPARERRLQAPNRRPDAACVEVASEGRGDPSPHSGTRAMPRSSISPIRLFGGGSAMESRFLQVVERVERMDVEDRDLRARGCRRTPRRACGRCTPTRRGSFTSSCRPSGRSALWRSAYPTATPPCGSRTPPASRADGSPP